MAEKLLSRYWLYDWIDEEGIRKPGDYHKAIRKRNAFDRLRELSALQDLDASKRDEPPGSLILAGRKVDLSGFLFCPDFDCLAPVVDSLFGRTWHYFDTVVVDALPLEKILFSGKDVYDLAQRVNLLLYLRQIGAENHIRFTPKVSGMCSQHFRQYAQDHHLGLDVLFDKDFENQVVAKLASEGAISLSPREGEWYYEILHQDIGKISGICAHSDLSNRPSNEEIARDAFGRYCTALISDVSASQSLRLPLFQAAENSWFTSDPPKATPDERIVALNIRLPVLTHVSAKEILKFRDDNQAHFERFRAALREAIREQIALAGSRSPTEIADAVIAEKIKPELAEIEVQLGAVRKTLARKVSANITVGGAAVGVGVMASIPLIIAATAMAGAASIAQIISKYSDEKKEIEASDLYFLWKARVRHKG